MIKNNSNLNTLFNSTGEGILPGLPTLPGQGEGFAYLGLGMLILCVICALILAFRNYHKKHSAKKELEVSNA